MARKSKDAPIVAVPDEAVPPPPATTVNGYQLQALIKLAKAKSDAAYKLFVKNILQFESDENKLGLENLYAGYAASEARLSRLQTIRSLYNNSVKVKVSDAEMSLTEAVNRLGGAGRGEKLWKLASQGEGETGRYGRITPDSTRSKDVEYAKRPLSAEACMAKMEEASKYAARLREAIYLGNSTVVTIGGADDILK